MKKQTDILKGHSAPIFTITTLGCKVNQYESDAITQHLKESGCVPIHSEEKANLCIVNTCTVTQKASMQSRQAVRQLIRSNPGARIVVTGCYAQTEPDEIKEIKGVHHIIGHADKYKIPDMVLSSREKDPNLLTINRRNIFHERDFKELPVIAIGSRTRPFLKIQDGCDAFCTYCIVPFARGPSRSMRSENVLEHIHQLKQTGYHEVVLSGVHLGAYGIDLSPPTSLTELLNRIYGSQTIHRVRLSSIEPPELTDDIIRIVAERDMFCRHFHIPLQSGDDHILKQMRRPYTSSLFRDLILTINESIPDAAIGVDVMLGFPGETEKAFENTYLLMEKLPVTYLHVFPFSPRKGTPAGNYPQKVPAKTIKDRCHKMLLLGNVKKRDFLKKYPGQKVEILIEGKRDSTTGLVKGITSNYLPVYVQCGDDLENTLVKVKIDRLDNNNRLYGTILI